METEQRERGPFADIADLVRRVSDLRQDEVRRLAQVGALNSLTPGKTAHRRAALWQAEAALRPAGPLLTQLPLSADTSPLWRMTDNERLVADYEGAGLTVGRHPMAHYRERLRHLLLARSDQLGALRNGSRVRVAGAVIARQRPGTAKGAMFISLEDEAGISNIVVYPDLFERQRDVLTRNGFLLVHGMIQSTDGVVHVRAFQVEVLSGGPALESHDFH